MSLASLIPQDIDPQTRALFEALISRIEVNASPALTDTDVRNQLIATTTAMGLPITETAKENTQTPSQPQGLIASGAFTSITLTWSSPTYAGHAFAEIYRSKTNLLSDAISNGLHAYSRANVYSDAVASGSTWYYFVRFVNLNGEVGQFAVTSGITANTNDEIFAALDGDIVATINGVHYIKTTAIQDASITNAKIANATIDNAKIASLDAAKINTGTLNAARIGASSISADKLSVTSLSAISANLGTVTAGTLTGTTIQTASYGSRISLDSAYGVRAINASGQVKAQINTDGSGWFGDSTKFSWSSTGTVSINGSIIQNDTLAASTITTGILGDGTTRIGVNATLYSLDYVSGDFPSGSGRGWELVGSATTSTFKVEKILTRDIYGRRISLTGLNGADCITGAGSILLMAPTSGSSNITTVKGTIRTFSGVITVDKGDIFTVSGNMYTVKGYIASNNGYIAANNGYITAGGSNTTVGTMGCAYGKFTTTALVPEVDNSLSNGASQKRWTTVYAVTGTINTSDARQKTLIEPLTYREILAAIDMSKLIGTYKFLDAIKLKGNTARTHIGVIVQEAINVLAKYELDPFKYSFICYDEPTIDEDTGEIVGTNTYGLRYEELLCFIAAGFEARLTQLEKQSEITNI